MMWPNVEIGLTPTPFCIARTHETLPIPFYLYPQTNTASNFHIAA